jgi:hypothetical protein
MLESRNTFYFNTHFLFIKIHINLTLKNPHYKGVKIREQDHDSYE